MEVAAVQFKARASWEAGRDALVALVQRAAVGRDLVVCPEMALAGYAIATPAEARAVAEPADGRTYAALAPIARNTGAWIVCGVPELAGDRVYNAAIVVDPTGALAFCYRKTLLFEADEPWATPGDSGYRAFETEKGRFGVGICMDLNDDRFLAWCHAAALDVIALPTNWVRDEESMIDYWAWRLDRGWQSGWGVPEHTIVKGRPPVRAVLVGANSYGREGAYVLEGRSVVLGPGRVLAYARPTGDAIVAATAKLSPPRVKR